MFKSHYKQVSLLSTVKKLKNLEEFYQFYKKIFEKTEKNGKIKKKNWWLFAAEFTFLRAKRATIGGLPVKATEGGQDANVFLQHLWRENSIIFAL